MAAFKARSKANAQPAPAAAAATAEEKQQTNAAAAAVDPYDAFITPISAANVVPASSPILASATPTAVPPRLSRANSRTHVPVQAEAAPAGGDAAAPAAPPPGHRSQRSVTLSNISVEGWGEEAEEESAQLHQRAAVTHSSSAAPASSPPSALVLAYKSDGEGGPLSARGSRSARGSKTKGTEHIQSWAEVEAMQKARAAEKAMLTARRKRQEQREAGMGEEDDAATASFGSPAPGQRTARSAASPLSPGSGQLTARSRGGANGLDSARGGIVPASGSAVLSALAQYERKKQMGLTSPQSARGTPNGSLTSRRDSPMSPAGVRGDFRDRRPLDPSAFDRDDHDQRAYSSSTFVPNTARAGAGGASPFSSPAAAAAAEQRRRDIQQRKERVRQRKAAALAAITLASTPVEQGGTLTARPGSSAQQQQRREGQPQATTGAPVGRTCELDFKDQNCVVM